MLYLSYERKYVVLAEAAYFDVFYYDELTIFLKDSPFPKICKILGVAFGNIEHSTGKSFRRSHEPFAVWIFPKTLQHLSGNRP